MSTLKKTGPFRKGVYSKRKECVPFEKGYTLKGKNWDPSEKGSTLKGKNLLPRGANSFLLEKIPFQKGIWCAGRQTGSHKSCLLCKTMAETLLLVYQAHLILTQPYFNDFVMKIFAMTKKRWRSCGMMLYLKVISGTIIS